MKKSGLKVYRLTNVQMSVFRSVAPAGFEIFSTPPAKTGSLGVSRPPTSRLMPPIIIIMPVFGGITVQDDVLVPSLSPPEFPPTL